MVGSKPQQHDDTNNETETADGLTTINLPFLHIHRHHMFRQMENNELRHYICSNEEKDKEALSKICVIDVRTTKQDYKGGHIPMSINYEYITFIKNIPKLIEMSFFNAYDNSDSYRKNNENKVILIFHCMYSQARGPQCCQWYANTLKYICDKYYCRKNHNLNIDNETEMKQYDFGRNEPITFKMLLNASDANGGGGGGDHDDSRFNLEGQFNDIKDYLDGLLSDKESNVNDDGDANGGDDVNGVRRKSNVMNDQVYEMMLEQNLWILRGGFQRWISAYYKLGNPRDEMKLIADFDDKYWDIDDYNIGNTKSYKLYHKNDW